MATTTSGATVDASHEHISMTFHEQGFALVPNLLTDEEVTRFRTAALDAVEKQSKEDKDFGTGIVATTDA